MPKRSRDSAAPGWSRFKAWNGAHIGICNPFRNAEKSVWSRFSRQPRATWAKRPAILDDYIFPPPQGSGRTRTSGSTVSERRQLFGGLGRPEQLPALEILRGVNLYISGFHGPPGKPYHCPASTHWYTFPRGTVGTRANFPETRFGRYRYRLSANYRVSDYLVLRCRRLLVISRGQLLD